jgi:hypothetical protein
MTGPELERKVRYLRAYNQSRAAATGARDAAIAEQLLATGGLDARQRHIAGVRAALPEWSWAQVGRALGLTKNQAACEFRRMSCRAGLREGNSR